MKTKFLFLAVLFTAIMSVSCNNENEVLAVRLDENKLELIKGESHKLNVTLVPSPEAPVTFEWFSEDEEYVTVDENGNVTAKAVKYAEESDEIASVKVYVRYEGGADECEVTVLPLATERVEIQYNSPQVNVEAGENVRLEVKVFPEDADLNDITWSSEYADVAVVSADGVVTGKKPGWTMIKAEYSEQIFDEILVTVAAVAAESVKIEPETLDITVGRKITLKSVLTPAYATDELIWTSDNNAVVKVIDAATGDIEAVAVGTAKVKVQAEKAFAECVVTVSEIPENTEDKTE